jgi:hypothetical protein
MKKVTANSTIPYHDIHLSAYLDYRGIAPVLFKEHGRVIFNFPNDSMTYRTISEYNANPQIPLLDYIRHLRKLRSMMLSMRD